MVWNKEKIQIQGGQIVEAQVPLIISASRSTDVPAFYSDWFFHRLEKGYLAWKNPFNGEKTYVSFKNTRFIVFWSKNPEPLLSHIDKLKNLGINCYIQFTLNDYESEGLEPCVPAVDKRIDTFKCLVDKLGFGHVIWRFDPLVLTNEISIDNLLQKIEKIGDQLQGYTEKMVFSFADIAAYKKVMSNLEKNNIKYSEWSDFQMNVFSESLSQLNEKWHYQLATCGEKIDVEKYGIIHNHCIDEELIVRFSHKDKILMDFLGLEIIQKHFDLFNDFVLLQNSIDIDDTYYAFKKKNIKDKGQRQFCGCIISKDIGEYNTCLHLCKYCYANVGVEIVKSNWKSHQNSKLGETITGK